MMQMGNWRWGIGGGGARIAMEPFSVRGSSSGVVVLGAAVAKSWVPVQAKTQLSSAQPVPAHSPAWSCSPPFLTIHEKTGIHSGVKVCGQIRSTTANGNEMVAVKCPENHGSNQND